MPFVDLEVIMKTHWCVGAAAAETLIAMAVLVAAGSSALLSAAVQLRPAQVTFAKDVAPILQRSCQNCHRPGSIAPMSLLTYDEARPWARSIKTKVTTKLAVKS